MPVIGFLHTASPDTYAPFIAAFRLGLKESGYVEGQNVASHASAIPIEKAGITRRGEDELCSRKLPGSGVGRHPALAGAARCLPNSL
jgi:hypothetical protein